jgi:hypothetical protein
MRDVCRPTRRLFLLLLLGSVAAAQSLPLTTISDFVYRADGSPAEGTLLISWPEFTTSGGLAVAAGNNSVTLGTAGALSVALVPNINATPANTVYVVVYQLDDGTVRTEYWIVPTTSPATLAEVRTTLGASENAAVFATQQFVTSAVATKANDSAVVHLAGGETITGTKQFSVAPSLPSPVQPGDAANKQYVDNSVQNLGSGNFLNLSGGTMTGPLTLSSDPAAPNQAATKHYSDLWAAVKANLIAGLVPPAELGSGTPNSATCLLGNQSWGPCSASGASSVYVNSAVISNPNFNSTTPGPQSNFLNCTFQAGSSTVSLECPYGSGSSSFALGSEAALNNQPNTFSTGLQDFSTARLKLPSGAGFAPATNGEIGFDTTANLPVIEISGVTQQMALTTSNISGQASTALALAGTPGQCNGSFATGIQANGNANCSVADVIELAETAPPSGIANYGIFWFDSATHTPRVIDNNGQAVQLGLVNVFNSDANTLEEYNGTTPQVFNLYGTRTDASDYERLRLGYDTTDGYFIASAEAAGSGTQRGLGFSLQGSLRWVIDPTFNFKPWSDNIKDVGSPTLRLKHMYLGTYADLTGGALVTEIPNEGSTGTTLNKLAKLTGAPATAILASTADATGIIGVAVDGAGTTGNAQIARGGQGNCVFDGRTVAGDYVQISSTVAGDCHDAGAIMPSSGQIIGRALSTNASAGTSGVLVAGGETRGGSLPSMNPGGFLLAATSSSIATTSSHLDVSQFPGTDAFAQVNACIAALPAGGGKCDAGNLPATASVSTNLTISKSNVEIDWGASTFAMGAGNTITISGSNVDFRCLGGAAGTATVFSFTSSTGSGTPGVSSGSVVTATGQNLHFRGCSILGNRIASGDNLSGASCFTGQGANGLVIEDSSFTNCGGLGINLSNLNNGTIEKNYIAQSSGPGIQLNAGTTGPFFGDVIRGNWLYDTDTSGAESGYELNVISSSGAGQLNKVKILNNWIMNDIVGGDQTGNDDVCTILQTPSIPPGSGSTGCLGGIQVSPNVMNYEIAGNVVRNTYAEGIAAGGWKSDIHDNDVSLNNVDQTGTVRNNGSGCVLYYIGNGIATQGDATIHDNQCSDSGYVVELALGKNVAQDGIVVENMDVHDNHGFTITSTLNAGIKIVNDTNSTPGGQLCGGGTRACNWTINNLTFSSNEVSAAILPWAIDTTGLTYTNGLAAYGPAGFLGTSPTAQLPLQSVAGFVSGTGSTANVAVTGADLSSTSTVAKIQGVSVGGTQGSSGNKLQLAAGGTSGDYASFDANLNVKDSGVSAGPYSIPWFTQPLSNGNGITLSASTNKAYLYGVVLTYAVTTTQVTYYVATADGSSNTYDIGIYQGTSASTDTLLAHVGSTAGTTFAPSTGWKTLSWTGSVTLQPGRYYLAITSSCVSSCAQIGSGSTNTGLTFDFNNSLGVATGGTLPASITGPSDSYAVASIPVWSVH